MQKSMRYHIADGENQPVVRAVALVVKPESTEASKSQPRVEAAQADTQSTHRAQHKSRWPRPSLRKAQLPSS